jgi:hypothetical protein
MPGERGGVRLDEQESEPIPVLVAQFRCKMEAGEKAKLFQPWAKAGVFPF